MTVQPIFDQVAAAMYLSEVHDLTDACLYQLKQLEKARRRWLKLKEIATLHTLHARAGMRDRKSQDGYHAAMRETGRVQSALFDGVEAFLAAWARLSLIFRPGRSRSPLRAFTVHRGATMRGLFALEAGHPLLDRATRDNWMHADERLDHAWIENSLGNRQAFVKTDRVKAKLRQTLRVIDVEALTVYTRDETGEVCGLALRDLAGVLRDLEARAKTAHERVDELPLIDD